jgi:hypothetical protein
MRQFPLNRREWLNRFGLGFGSLALADLLGRPATGASRRGPSE